MYDRQIMVSLPCSVYCPIAHLTSNYTTQGHNLYKPEEDNCLLAGHFKKNGNYVKVCFSRYLPPS
jgi:hypothetical protein